MNVYKINQIYKIAFNLLEEKELNRIPVDTLTLAKKLNVCLFKYSDLDKESLNFLLKSEVEKEAFSRYERETNLFYLFYDDELTSTRLRYVLARELSKFIFKDVTALELEEIKEYFPVLLLVPMYSLFFLSSLSINLIMEQYDVSKETASLALTCFNKRIKLYGNKMFRYEEETFEIFKIN